MRWERDGVTNGSMNLRYRCWRDQNVRCEWAGERLLAGVPPPLAAPFLGAEVVSSVDVVLPIDAEDYERRVAVATVAVDKFGDQLVSELDEQNGGFSWWAGYSDWKTMTILSDYLIQLVYGVSESMLSASLAAKSHREKVTADDYALQDAAKRGGSLFPLNAQARRRACGITESAESCFFHLGQALDRLAVAVFIVGGFEINDAMKLDWTKIEEAADELLDGSARKLSSGYSACWPAATCVNVRGNGCSGHG